MKALAQKLFWWKQTEEIETKRLVAKVMTHGTFEDILEVEKVFGMKKFAHALSGSPAGTFDRRSWSYWHKRLGHSAVPALPEGKLPWPPR